MTVLAGGSVKAAPGTVTSGSGTVVLIYPAGYDRLGALQKILEAGYFKITPPAG